MSIFLYFLKWYEKIIKLKKLNTHFLTMIFPLFVSFLVVVYLILPLKGDHKAWLMINRD